MIGVGLTAILVLGVSAQWIGWRLRVPGILLLLLFGFLAGPIAEWAQISLFDVAPENALFLDIETLFASDQLLALVALAVGFILFEGGLTLNFSEIRQVKRGVTALVTVGAAVTWVIATAAAGFILDLPWSIAALLGAILTVTGPTVIGPLLRFIRPTGSVGKVLKWEGIVIDPIGALLAVLVFEAVREIYGLGGHHHETIAAGEETAATMSTSALVLSFVWGGIKASVVGSAFGAAGGFLLVQMIKRFLIPDYLQIPVTLAVVAAIFTASNTIAHEAGLFATTLMGIVLANQKSVRVSHILEFKEPLTVLLIALLFIALSARLELQDLQQINPIRAAGFLIVLILIARPAAVFLSMMRTSLTTKDKFFLSWMAPRGIVAAAIASVFGLALSEGDNAVPGAELLTPYVFLVIVVTVAVYGLTATIVAKRLGLADPENAGFLIAGASPAARMIGKAIRDEKVEVLMVDLSYANIQQARFDGLPTMMGNILSPQVQERIELTGIGRLLAMTANNEVNSLAVVQFGKHFGRSNVFQLPRAVKAKRPATVVPGASEEGDPAPQKQAEDKKREEVGEELRGRLLFNDVATFAHLERLVSQGAQVRKTKLTKEFTFKQWQETHRAEDEEAVPLLLIGETGEVSIFATDKTLSPKAGHTVVALSLLNSEADPAEAKAKHQRKQERKTKVPGDAAVPSAPDI